MRILHYSLGFPPFRSGGLTKYCCDLMLSQVSRGNDVALVWPGRLCGRFSFKAGLEWNGVGNFEMINPLPVPYDEGVCSPRDFIESRNFDVCIEFLKRINPDVLHVHSLMGLPLELVSAARYLGIRAIFTTHDYYPVCPKVTFFHCGAMCDQRLDRSLCPTCNASGLSMRKMRLLQSPLYRNVKDWTITRALRSRHRVTKGSNYQNLESVPKSDTLSYRQLLDRNISLLDLFDSIHANSELAKDIYSSFIPGADIRVIPIANAETQACHFSSVPVVHNPIKLGYFGPQNVVKGYYVLLDSLRQLWSEGYRFELHVYGSFDCDEPFVVKHDRYVYSQIDDVYSGIDLAVVPSLCPETFSFQAIEALCRGVPVVISDLVGMKDILQEGMGVIFDSTIDGLVLSLREVLDPDQIISMKRAIRIGFRPPSLELVEAMYTGEE